MTLRNTQDPARPKAGDHTLHDGLSICRRILGTRTQPYIALMTAVGCKSSTNITAVATLQSDAHAGQRSPASRCEQRHRNPTSRWTRAQFDVHGHIHWLDDDHLCATSTPRRFPGANAGVGVDSPSRRSRADLRTFGPDNVDLTPTRRKRHRDRRFLRKVVEHRLCIRERCTAHSTWGARSAVGCRSSSVADSASHAGESRSREGNVRPRSTSSWAAIRRSFLRHVGGRKPMCGRETPPPEPTPRAVGAGSGEWFRSAPPPDHLA